MRLTETCVRASVAMALAVLLAWLPAPEAVAQTCCPGGCVANGYGTGCWQNGTTNSCTPVACQSTPSPSGPPAGKGTPGVAPPTGSGCPAYLTDASIAAEAAACVSNLTASATLVGCYFEDDAGRHEDLRVGMTCPSRQAALAARCRAKCAQFAQDYHNNLCDARTVKDEFWKAAFGSIGGTTYGSANVQACGPPLKSIAVKALPRTDNRDQKYLDLKKK
jgi:hypothetical protein